MRERSKTRPSDTEFRHQWISRAAYYKAESRHFEPGKEIDDWIFAEKEFVKMLITRYQVIMLEDDGITVKGLQRLAKSLGIRNAEKNSETAELIKAIQRATDSPTCFSFEAEFHCAQPKHCPWESQCQNNKMIPRW